MLACLPISSIVVNFLLLTKMITASKKEIEIQAVVAYIQPTRSFNLVHHALRGTLLLSCLQGF